MHQKKAPGVFHGTPRKWHKCSGTLLLTCHQVCLLGLQPSGVEGLSLKVFIVDLQPSHELWGFEVQDVLWVSFNLWISPCRLLFHQLHYQQCFQSIASLYRKFICQSHVGAHEWNSHLAQIRRCRGYLTSIASTWHGCPTAVLAEVPSPKGGRRWDSPPWGFISAGFVQTVSSYFMYISHFPSTSLHPCKFLVQLSTRIKISFNSQRVHFLKKMPVRWRLNTEMTHFVIEGCVICCFH